MKIFRHIKPKANNVITIVALSITSNGIDKNGETTNANIEMAKKIISILTQGDG